VPISYQKPKEKSKETKENEIIVSLKNLMRARIESDLKNKRSASNILDKFDSVSVSAAKIQVENLDNGSVFESE
jgi:hypothetical protein